jgi:hypothetical protein
MQRNLKSTQRLSRVLAIKIDTTTPTIIRGTSDILSVVKNSAGNITIVFKNPFKAIPLVTAISEVANCIVTLVAGPTVSSISLIQQTIAGVATNGIMHIQVWGFDTKDVF